MKINLSEQISKMNGDQVSLTEAAQTMTVESIKEYLDRNEKLCQYVSWLCLAYKKDRIDLLKKMIDMFHKEGFGAEPKTEELPVEMAEEPLSDSEATEEVAPEENPEETPETPAEEEPEENL